MFQVLKKLTQAKNISDSQGSLSKGPPAADSVPRTANKLSQKVEKLEAGERSDSERNEFQQRSNRRKSRLGTGAYLTPKTAISKEEREVVILKGYLKWRSPAKRPLFGKAQPNGEPVYALLQNGNLLLFADSASFSCSDPSLTISISNSYSRCSEEKGEIRISLLEDDELHILMIDGPDPEFVKLKNWAKELNRVSYRWGENQKIELEHEIAGMRKQLGQLWELCAEDPNQPKVQKRIADLSLEIQLKDSLMADATARQDEFSMLELKNRVVNKDIELFGGDSPEIPADEKEDDNGEDDSELESVESQVYSTGPTYQTLNDLNSESKDTGSPKLHDHHLNGIKSESTPSAEKASNDKVVDPDLFKNSHESNDKLSMDILSSESELGIKAVDDFTSPATEIQKPSHEVVPDIIIDQYLLNQKETNPLPVPCEQPTDTLENEQDKIANFRKKMSISTMGSKYFPTRQHINSTATNTVDPQDNSNLSNIGKQVSFKSSDVQPASSNETQPDTFELEEEKIIATFRKKMSISKSRSASKFAKTPMIFTSPIEDICKSKIDQEEEESSQSGAISESKKPNAQNRLSGVFAEANENAGPNGTPKSRKFSVRAPALAKLSNLLIQNSSKNSESSLIEEEETDRTESKPRPSSFNVQTKRKLTIVTSLQSKIQAPGELKGGSNTALTSLSIETPRYPEIVKNTENHSTIKEKDIIAPLSRDRSRTVGTTRLNNRSATFHKYSKSMGGQEDHHPSDFLERYSRDILTSVLHENNTGDNLVTEETNPSKEVVKEEQESLITKESYSETKPEEPANLPNRDNLTGTTAVQNITDDVSKEDQEMQAATKSKRQSSLVQKAPTLDQGQESQSITNTISPEDVTVKIETKIKHTSLKIKLKQPSKIGQLLTSPQTNYSANTQSPILNSNSVLETILSPVPESPTQGPSESVAPLPKKVAPIKLKIKSPSSITVTSKSPSLSSALSESAPKSSSILGGINQA